MKIEIGDIFHDINHCWTDGSDNLDMIHIILSADRIKFGPGKYSKESYWEVSNHMSVLGNYCGGRIRHFRDDEILLMKKVGNIKDIISFDK